MIIRIGETIKNLRTRKKCTQETLAGALGVTPQAISRWESGSGYPDMELLPALADFFCVTIDELLGYRLSAREEQLVQTKKEVQRLAETGTLAERLTFARTALLRYPYDCELRENLAVCLYHQWCETGDMGIYSEIEALCTSVMERTDDPILSCDALNVLRSLYIDTGKTEKARALIENLPPMVCCKEDILANGIGDGNAELYIQDAIDRHADAVGCLIQSLVLDDEISNAPDTWDRKIALCSRAIDFYRFIYGEDCLFYHCRLSMLYWLRSTYEIAQGKTEDTLASLEQMTHHALAYDHAYIHDRGKHFQSILCDHIVYPEPGTKGFHEVDAHNDAYYMLDHIMADRYDGIRNYGRFCAVEETLRAHAT